MNTQIAKVFPIECAYKASNLFEVLGYLWRKGVRGITKVIKYYQTSGAVIIIFEDPGRGWHFMERKEYTKDSCISLLRLLQEIHSHGIAHLGISPEVILAKGREIRLIGFENACVLLGEANEEIFPCADPTPHYSSMTAPELFEDHLDLLVPPHSDLYSMGKVMQEMSDDKTVKYVGYLLSKENPSERIPISDAIHLLSKEDIIITHHL